VHVVAGTTAVITGATAALAHKPGPRHLQAGRRYYRAIIVLSGTGAVLAIMRWREDAYLLVIAAVMVSAATIGVRARRRRNRAGDTIHILGLSLSFVAMMTGFYVDNGPHLPLLGHLPAIAFWVLPSAVGSVLAAWSVRRAARGHYAPAAHHLAIVPAGTAGTPGTQGPAGTVGPVGVADDG
jgi:lipopolysaccharide export LptBFGC system permease protein LptF